MNDTAKRAGYNVVFQPADGESIIGMVEFKGAVIIATTKGIFRMVNPDGPAEPLRLVEAPPAE